jgi:hypothetical protein
MERERLSSFASPNKLLKRTVNQTEIRKRCIDSDQTALLSNIGATALMWINGRTTTLASVSVQ